jgi:hypothetical protein
VSSTVKKDARTALIVVIAAVLMLALGLVLVFAPLRKLTLGSRPSAPQIRAAMPEVQGARNDAATPDVAPALIPAPVQPPAIAPVPEADLRASDAGAGPPVALAETEAAEAGADAAVVAARAVDAAAQNAVDAGSAVPPVAPPPVVFCGVISCPTGKVCCNPSCGICTDPGEDCSHAPCLSSTTPVSIYCGPNTCNVGQVCCNVSCGICVSPGETCDQTPCAGAPEIPISFTCGMATCNVGMVCCNASCGICAPPGEKCSTEVCD